MIHLSKILQNGFQKNIYKLPNSLSLLSNFYSTESKVEHEPEHYMFILGVGNEGGKAVLEYSRQEDVMDLCYTYVPPLYRHQGIGKILAMSAFMFVENNNLKMDVTCDYLKKILDQHSHYKKFHV